MASYYTASRSNYFLVKDEEAFRCEAEELGVDVWDGVGEHVGRVAIAPNEIDQGWPFEVDVPEFLSRHLQDEEVAILVQSGAEKLNYIGGYALAINNRGQTVEVRLDDIYALATTLGSSVTRAED